MDIENTPNKTNQENIPAELRRLKQWVTWTKEERDGKIAKVPKIAGTQRNASSANPNTWRDFETAWTSYQAGECAGVGFVFSKSDAYCGIDLDKCRDPETGNIQKWAQEILQTLNSYSELSQSGKGIHIIVGAALGDLTGTKKRLPGTNHEIEIYDRRRFFATTGGCLPEYPTVIESRQKETLKLYKTLNPSPEPKAKPPAVPTTSNGSGILDEVIIEKASTARNRDKFLRLMDGDISEYSSGSEGDLGLCSLLSFWTQDRAQILRIVRQSGLWDEKWKRQDYQTRTIEKVLADVGEIYDWTGDRRKGRQATPSGSTEHGELEPLQSPASSPAFDMETCMPTEGFLKNYVDYMLPMTEAPAQYHLFAGLMMLATVIQQRVYFTIADERKYLNLWAVLIGPSGCKKSTSINKARQILANSGWKDSLFPTQVTSEKLIPMLANKSIGTFFWPEWGATMDQWGKGYAVDMMSIFTALFDGEYFSRYLKNERYVIASSSINLFCGCTPSWLKKTIKQSDVAMGFWPRFLFVPAVKREKYLANPPKGDQELRDSIENRLKSIQAAFPTNESVEIDFSKVDDIYGHWYEKFNRAADEDVSHPFMAASAVRLSDYAKKLSALMEISSSISTVVLPETMGYTLDLIDWLQKAVISITAKADRDESVEMEHRVYELISQAGGEGMKHSTLRQQLHRYSQFQVEPAIRSLIDAERIKVEPICRTGRGRPGKKYVPV